MAYLAVTTVVEEPMRVSSRDCRECLAHRLYQDRAAGTRLGTPQQPLDLREGLLYGVEVGRVGWQVEKLTASPFDEVLETLPPL